MSDSTVVLRSPSAFLTVVELFLNHLCEDRDIDPIIFQSLKTNPEIFEGPARSFLTMKKKGFTADQYITKAAEVAKRELGDNYDHLALLAHSIVPAVYAADLLSAEDIFAPLEIPII